MGNGRSRQGDLYKRKLLPKYMLLIYKIGNCLVVEKFFFEWG
jgi:hypothetical protein